MYISPKNICLYAHKVISNSDENVEDKFTSKISVLKKDLEENFTHKFSALKKGLEVKFSALEKDYLQINFLILKKTQAGA